jgi:hypothetical protein
MDDARKIAFGFAADLTKQLITLSTGILALTLTFASNVLGAVPGTARGLLIVSWFIYILSITCGVLTLMMLTGILEPAKAKPATTPVTADEPTTRDARVTRWSGYQIIFFGLATFAILLSGIISLSPSRESRPAAGSAERTQREFVGAIVAGDWPALDTLLSDEWVVRHRDTILLSKPELRSYLGGGVDRRRIRVNDDFQLYIGTNVAIGSGFMELADSASAAFGTFMVHYSWNGKRWIVTEVALNLFAPQTHASATGIRPVPQTSYDPSGELVP